MTDPRDVLGGAQPPREEPDLGAIHRRTAELRRHRRVAAGIAVAAVLVAGAGAFSLLRPGPGDDASSYIAAVPTTQPTTSPTIHPTTTATPTARTSESPAPRPTRSTPAPSGSASTPEPDPTPTSGPDRTPTAPASPTGTPAAPFPADTSPDEAEAVGAGFTVTSVRTGVQDGYERIVYELAGPAESAPGWRVSYVDEAVLDGSGDVVSVGGSAILQVTLTGLAGGIEEGGNFYAGRHVPTDTRVVRDVVTNGIFEGTAQSFVGLESEAPFRVFRLEDPARVVIDVLSP